MGCRFAGSGWTGASRLIPVFIVVISIVTCCVNSDSTGTQNEHRTNTELEDCLNLLACIHVSIQICQYLGYPLNFATPAFIADLVLLSYVFYIQEGILSDLATHIFVDFFAWLP